VNSTKGENKNNTNNIIHRTQYKKINNNTNHNNNKNDNTL